MIEQSVNESTRILESARIYEMLGSNALEYVDVEKAFNQSISLFSLNLPMISNKCQGLSVLADSFISQLFYNLIDNTRKYGVKTTAINLHFTKDDNNLKLTYEDDGVGIPEDNKKQLFKGGFSTGGSTGFGLFLSKKMIEVNGWTILETGEPGMGARFEITIPKTNKNGQTNYHIHEDVTFITINPDQQLRIP